MNKGANIIVLIDGKDVETWGSLRELCNEHGFNYNTLCRKSFPFVIEGLYLQKIKHRTKGSKAPDY